VLQSPGLGVHAVFFIDASTGWVVGTNGLILRTDDSGASWIFQSTDPGRGDLFGVTFVDANRGWAVSMNTSTPLLYTRDGGTTWHAGDQDRFPPPSLRGVSFVDVDNGSAAGLNDLGGTILRTTDGGLSWRTTLSGNPPPPPFRGVGVSFGDPNIGFAANGDLLLIRTRDGGASWTAGWHPDHPTSVNVVSFLDANTGWAGGFDFELTTRPAALTTDGGATWSGPFIASLGYNPNVRALSIVGENSVWAVGVACDRFGNCQGLVASTDGDSWRIRDTLPGGCFRGSCAFVAVSFVDANTGWIANDGTIEHTADGGGSWTRQFSLIGAGLRGLSFVDASYGWAVGSRGRVWRTTDGGTSWVFQSSGTQNDLYALAALDASTATAVGASGTILRTTNGGANWTLQPSRTNIALLAVSFLDPDTGWIVGEPVLGEGIILRTITGGE